MAARIEKSANTDPPILLVPRSGSTKLRQHCKSNRHIFHQDRTDDLYLWSKLINNQKGGIVNLSRPPASRTSLHRPTILPSFSVSPLGGWVGDAVDPIEAGDKGPLRPRYVLCVPWQQSKHRVQLGLGLVGRGNGYGGGGCTHVKHGRSRTTIDPRSPTMPGRNTSGFQRQGRQCLHQPRNAARCSASRIKGELHATKIRLCGGLPNLVCTFLHMDNRVEWIDMISGEDTSRDSHVYTM